MRNFLEILRHLIGIVLLLVLSPLSWLTFGLWALMDFLCQSVDKFVNWNWRWKRAD